MSYQLSRPSLRFSLRTLFVVVTVGCVWLGWNVNVIRTRNRMRVSLQADRASFSHDDNQIYSISGGIVFPPLRGGRKITSLTLILGRDDRVIPVG